MGKIMNIGDLLYFCAGIALALVGYFADNVFVQFAAGLALFALFMARTILDGFFYPDR